MTTKTEPNYNRSHLKYSVNRKLSHYVNAVEKARSEYIDCLFIIELENLIRSCNCYSRINRQVNYHIFSNPRIISRRSIIHPTFPIKAWLKESEEDLRVSLAPVLFDNKETVYSLLGTRGENVLNKVINLIQKEADKKKWPLISLSVNSARDIEIQTWEYVLVLLNFNTCFKDADLYLHELYNQLDVLALTLTEEGQEILQKKIYFDVGTSVS